MHDDLNDASQYEWASGMWQPFVDQAIEVRRQDMAPKDDSAEGILARLRRLEDERAIEHVFRRYHAAYDAADLDLVLSCYTEDAIQVNARGTYRGHHDLKRSYRWLTTGQKFVIHHGTNVVTHFYDDDPDRATSNAFWICSGMTVTGQFILCGGTYLHEMRRENGEWLIAKQRITVNYQTEQTVIPREFGDRVPAAEGDLTTLDLIEERYLLS